MYVCVHTYVCIIKVIKILHICNIGSASITNGITAVIVKELECEVTYTIIVGGKLNGDLVGPRSSHGTITAGPCQEIPILMPSDGMYVYTYKLNFNAS